MKKRDPKGFKKNVDVITGRYSFISQKSDGDAAGSSDSPYDLKMRFNTVSYPGLEFFAGFIIYDNPLKVASVTNKMPFGEGKKIGKKKYQYYDADGNILGNVIIDTDRRFEGGPLDSGGAGGSFTLTLSERKLIFEDMSGKRAATAMWVNDLL